MNTLDLERTTFALQQHVSDELAADFGMPAKVQIERHMFGGMALTLRQEVYAQHLERATVRYPETWRDAVKHRLYAWLRSGHWPWGADLMERRRPVKWHDATIDVKALYPKIGIPSERHAVQVQRFDDTSTESRRLWFNAEGHGIVELVHQLMYEGRTGCAWAVGRSAYYALVKARDDYSSAYLFGPPSQNGHQMVGLPVTIDGTVPMDTVELRDGQNRIVGKIYNIA